MNMLLFLSLIALASATAVDPCAKGQIYWCSSLKTAKQCGAVKHCIENVWMEQTPYKNDERDVCGFCENVISDARNMFSEKNEAKVEKYLDSACGMIPVPEFSDRCKDYVKNDIGEVFQLMRSKLDPGAVCSCIGLCKSYKGLVDQSKPDVLVKAIQDVELSNWIALEPASAKSATTTPAGNICKDCEKLVQDIKQQITSQTTEDELKNMLKQKICQVLGGLSDECSQVVDTYVPELLEMLQEQVDPTMVCGVLGLCSAEHTYLVRRRLMKTPLYKAALQIGGKEECTACKFVMSELQSFDRNNAIQADIENMIKSKLCSRLGSLQDKCVQTVDEYGQFLFEFLANELDPATRCQSLGFCSADNSIFATRKATPVTKPVKKDVTQSPECVLCEFIIKELDDILEKNSTEDEVIQAVEKVCSVLPDTIKMECTSFISQYGAAIIDLLAQEMDPAMVCSTLGLCTPPGHRSTKKEIKAVMAGDEMCGVCEVVIQYIGSLLEENATEAQIEGVLNKVCNFLPKDFESECRTFVKQYGPELVQLLVQTLDPKQICTDLKLCTSVKNSKRPAQTSMVLLKPAKAHLVGVNECTYGPAYWCKSGDNAKKCGAVSHCMKHAWKDGKPPQ